MSTRVRNYDSLKVDALVTAHNALRRDLQRLKSGVLFHADASTAVSTANASTEETAVALANALKAAYNTHVASLLSATTGQGAHMGDASAGAVATANATNEASAITLANAIKAAYNTHRASAVFHNTADSTNAVSSADATDTASLYTLLNEIKTDLNAHFAGAFASQALEIVAP